jgi:hypothetical protein
VKGKTERYIIQQTAVDSTPPFPEYRVRRNGNSERKTERYIIQQTAVDSTPPFPEYRVRRNGKSERKNRKVHYPAHSCRLNSTLP